MLEREDIYQRVWGYTMARGDRSVDVFVRKLRQKLERVSPEWRYVHTHFGVGYRFAAERADGSPVEAMPAPAPAPPDGAGGAASRSRNARDPSSHSVNTSPPVTVILGAREAPSSPYTVDAALVLLCSAAAVALAATGGGGSGRIGPSLRITGNGRLLSPQGKLVTLGHFPTGGALTPDGRFLWTVSTGRALNDIRIVAVAGKHPRVIQILALARRLGRDRDRPHAAAGLRLRRRGLVQHR